MRAWLFSILTQRSVGLLVAISALRAGFVSANCSCSLLTVVLRSSTLIKDQFMIRKLLSYRQLNLFLSLNSH